MNDNHIAMKQITIKRNTDFIRLCNQLTLQSVFSYPLISTDDIIETATKLTAPRYYVDLDNANNVLNRMLTARVGIAPKPSDSLRVRMWKEILAKLIRIRGVRNNQVIRSKLAHLLNVSRASSFFISATYARNLYYETKYAPPGENGSRRYHIRHSKNHATKQQSDIHHQQ